MVNKQYTVQSVRKKSGNQSSPPPPPPPTRNVTVISSIPNPQQKYKVNNISGLSTDILNSAHLQEFPQSSVYGRNITYQNEDYTMMDPMDNDADSTRTSSVKTINDIGRFQYILQMDREIVSRPNISI